MLRGADLHSGQTRWLSGELVDLMISPLAGGIDDRERLLVTVIRHKGPALDLTHLTVALVDAAGSTYEEQLDSDGHVVLSPKPGPYRLSVTSTSGVLDPGPPGANSRGGSPSAPPRRRRPSSWQFLTAAAAVIAAVALLAPFLPWGGSPAVATSALLPVRCETTTGTSTDQRVVVAAVWGGTERERFLKVLKRFEKSTGFAVTFATDSSDPDRDIGNTLNRYIAAGCPPDVVLLPQPGLLRWLAAEGKLMSLDRIAADLLRDDYVSGWAEQTKLPGDDGLYGIPFKGANKSLIWYNPKAFELAGVTTPPATFEELKEVAGKLERVGIAPFAVSGKDGWTLTDWFENVYLKMWGPDAYDDLAEHRIRWTDDTVKQTLATLAELFAGPGWVAGGTRGARNTSYEESVALVFGGTGLPKAAMVAEGDFVANEIAKTDAKIGVDARFFEFPAVRTVANGIDTPDGTFVAGSKAVGGDLAALVEGRATSAAKALIRFLATPEAAEVWLREGGFISPNRRVDPGSYPEPVRQSAEAVTETSKVNFDLSDRQHPQFGSDRNHGMLPILQEFLVRPDTVDETARRLEDAWKPLPGAQPS